MRLEERKGVRAAFPLEAESEEESLAVTHQRHGPVQQNRHCCCEASASVDERASEIQEARKVRDSWIAAWVVDRLGPATWYESQAGTVLETSGAAGVGEVGQGTRAEDQEASLHRLGRSEVASPLAAAYGLQGHRAEALDHLDPSSAEDHEDQARPEVDEHGASQDGQKDSSGEPPLAENGRGECTEPD